MNEFDLIKRLTRDLPANAATIVGPGDDCAVLDLGSGDKQVLFKTDAVVEGIHFTAETDPKRVGRKALARCLSDIAAMGGTAVSALVTIGLPVAHDVARIEAIYEGMNALAKAHGVSISGGETTTNPERILISVALIGTVPRGRAVLRSGAKVGDAIFVSGQLGGSIEGKHLDFEPRLAEGKWLAESGKVHAMIDVSDGLAGDLRHILQQSGVGADVMSNSIPISKIAKMRARESSTAKPALLAALTDGEDFELVFTVASKDAVKVLDGWKAQFPQVPLTCIGKISAKPGLRLCNERGVREFNTGGYEHFAGGPA